MMYPTMTIWIDYVILRNNDKLIDRTDPNQIFMACHPSMHLALAHLQLLCFREALSGHCLQENFSFAT